MYSKKLGFYRELEPMPLELLRIVYTLHWRDNRLIHAYCDIEDGLKVIQRNQRGWDFRPICFLQPSLTLKLLLLICSIRELVGHIQPQDWASYAYLGQVIFAILAVVRVLRLKVFRKNLQSRVCGYYKISYTWI